MKRLLSLISKVFWVVLIYIIFIILCCFIVLAGNEFFRQGLHTSFEDLYGKWSIWFGIVVCGGVFTSPLYLRKWIKKEIFISIASVLMSIAFVIMAFLTYWVTYEQFTEFTTEKWQNYKRQRLIMLDDLRENHMEGEVTRSEISKMLGEPDRILENGTFEYSYNYGYISVFFDGEKVSSLEGIDPFGKHY